MNTDLQQINICKYCEKTFSRPTTLSVHMCVRKRRHLEIDTPGSRFGLQAFQLFYTLASNSKKTKTAQEFIESEFYGSFAKFGNHLVNLRPIYPEEYMRFVITTGVKLKDWTKDDTYYSFVDHIVKKEPAATAAERTIGEIIKWSETNNKEFGSFFTDITANEASHLIKTGKISPWVLYLCNTGEILMKKFNDDHSKIIGNIIDPGFWMKKFKKQAEDVTYITNLLEQAGL